MKPELSDAEEIICTQCNQALVKKQATFHYLGHVFRVDLPRCPECGQLYLSEELVKGRMAEVEMELEDK